MVGRNWLLCGVALLVACQTAGAWNSFPICTASGTQIRPSIDGDIVAWHDERDGAEIYGYDLSTSSEFYIGGDYSDSPDVSGNTVVWHRFIGGERDIYGYDISTGQTSVICDAAGRQDYAAIDGNVVVWSDYRNSTWDIYGRDLTGGGEFPICDLPSEAALPEVDGGIVVWSDDRNGNSDIFGYNLSTHTEFTICTDPADQWYPTICENLVVWWDSRQGGSDIYAYDLLTQQEQTITTGKTLARQAVTNGRYVFWIDQPADSWWTVFCHDLLTGTESELWPGVVPDVSGNILVWSNEYGDLMGAVIPEPATMSLLGLGALALLKRRK